MPRLRTGVPAAIKRLKLNVISFHQLINMNKLPEDITQMIKFRIYPTGIKVMASGFCDTVVAEIPKFKYLLAWNNVYIPLGSNLCHDVFLRKCLTH